MEWLDLGYLGLFLAAFLAATVIPFSSEAIFIAALAIGLNPAICLFAATLGNWLGGMTSYGLGWLGNLERITKWLGTSEKQLARWHPRISQFGPPFALLCWLPFIGDAIAIVLGVLRTRIVPTSIFMLIGKILRYAILLYGFFQVS